MTLKFNREEFRERQIQERKELVKKANFHTKYLLIYFTYTFVMFMGAAAFSGSGNDFSYPLSLSEEVFIWFITPIFLLAPAIPFMFLWRYNHCNDIKRIDEYFKR